MHILRTCSPNVCSLSGQKLLLILAQMPKHASGRFLIQQLRCCEVPIAPEWMLRFPSANVLWLRWWKLKFPLHVQGRAKVITLLLFPPPEKQRLVSRLFLCRCLTYKRSVSFLQLCVCCRPGRERQSTQVQQHSELTGRWHLLPDIRGFATWPIQDLCHVADWSDLASNVGVNLDQHGRYSTKVACRGIHKDLSFFHKDLLMLTRARSWFSSCVQAVLSSFYK